MKNLKFMISAIALRAAIFACNTEAHATRTVIALKCMRPDSSIVAKDTCTNADTTYLFLYDANTGGIKAFNEFEDLIYTWSVVPGITGTTTGTVTIEGSMTGNFSNSLQPTSDWVPMISDVTQYNGSSSISISGSALMWEYFILPKNQFKYIRIRYITSGTQTSTISGTVSVLPHA